MNYGSSGFQEQFPVKCSFIDGRGCLSAGKLYGDVADEVCSDCCQEGAKRCYSDLGCPGDPGYQVWGGYGLYDYS